MAPYLGFLAIAIAWGIHAALNLYGFTIPWWSDAPTPIVLYFVLRRWFDQSLWRFRFLRRIGVVMIPDLNGKWVGSLMSPSANREPLACEARIKQTWTQIGIVLETEYSRSGNLIAGILVDGVYDAELTYEYVNEPKPSAVRTMQKHKGSASLRLMAEQSHMLLQGDYFTGRGRETSGELTLRRET
jgi:hypothetical protein